MTNDLRRRGPALWFLLAVLFSGVAFGAESIEPSFTVEKPKTLSVTLNVGEIVGFGIGSMLVGVGYLPLHLDLNYLISNSWQINVGLVFRYDWGSYIGPEFIGMVGARYSLSGSGLFGSFVSLKAGPGYVNGTNNTTLVPRLGTGTYSSFEFGVQPEAGYSFALGSNGYLTLGGGILFIAATPQGGRWSTLGVIVHQIVPIADVGLGIAL